MRHRRRIADRPSCTRRDSLVAKLAALSIASASVSHAPVFTCEEAAAEYGRLGLEPPYCKNLLVKDKKGGIYLVVALEDTKVDLAKVGARLGVGKSLRLAPDELLAACLGVVPGGVTPFALLDRAAATKVRVIVDEKLRGLGKAHFHPPSGNDATISLATDDLVRALQNAGFEAHFVDLELKVVVSKDAPPDLAHLVAEKGAAEELLGSADGGDGSAPPQPKASKQKQEQQVSKAAPSSFSPSDPKALTKQVLALMADLDGEERERELELTLTLALADAYAHGLASVCPKPNFRCL